MKKSKKILIIDDDPEVQIALKKVLDILGHKSFCADSGVKAFEILSHDVLPSLIFCDLMMPSMNGLAFLSNIKNNPDENLSSIPVVILSAEKNLKKQVTPFHVDYLSKAFKINDLISIVERYCGH
ncbi:MAG: response regulator [Bacteriovorax sp.]|nr:response regulator [Bacteriovorax sp.]